MTTLRRHYFSTLAANAAILLLGTGSSILAARLLGPVGRGELAAITLWPMALATLGALGLHRSITFFAAQQPARRPGVLGALLALATVQSLVLVTVGYILLPRLLNRQQPLILTLAQAFLLAIPLMLLSGYLLNLLQGGLHLDSYNFSRVFVAAWYALLLAVLFLLHRPSLGALVVGQGAGYAAACLLNTFLVRRHFHLSPQWDPGLFKPLLSYGAKTHLGSVSAYLNLRVDQLIMSIWLPPEQLGFYVVAVTLTSPLLVLPEAIGIVTLPAAARESPATARAVIRRSFRTVVLLLVAGAALLFLLLPYLVPLFFGQRFAPVIPAARVLALATIPLGLRFVLSESLRALNRPLATLYGELVGNALTLPLLALWLPRYGFLGAAYASLAAYTASLVTLLWYSRSRVGLSPMDWLRAAAAEPPAPPDAAPLNPTGRPDLNGP